MFDKKAKRYFIVISKCGEVRNGTHYPSIDSAREGAINLAKEHKNIEFLVCGVDSSYVDRTVTSTHYY